MYIELVNMTSNPEMAIERFAKVSHASKLCNTLSEQERFVKKLIELGHESVLEAVDFTFYVQGISRACSHQLVRHRLASYCQKSQRYCDESNFDTVIPKSCNAYRDNICRLFDEIQKLYTEMVSHGVPREDARYILPNATTTEIMVKMNTRELRHFFKLRCTKHAQWEIRELALAMLELCYKNLPCVFEDLYNEFIKNKE